MKNIFILILTSFLLLFTINVHAQKNKKKKKEDTEVVMSQPLEIRGVACLNCDQDPATYDFASSGFSNYFSDSSGQNFYYKLNDTVALHARLEENFVLPAFKKTKFIKLRNSFHFQYISTSNSVTPLMGLYTSIYKYDTSAITIYDVVAQKKFGRVIFPAINKYDNGLIHCSYMSSILVNSGDKRNAVAIMSFVDNKEKKQYIRGFVLDSVNTRIIDFDTPNHLFEVILNVKDEYAEGRTVYGASTSDDGSFIALLLSGRNEWGTLYIAAKNKQHRFLEKTERFGLSAEGKLTFLQKGEGYGNYIIGEITNPYDTTIQAKKINSFITVANYNGTRFSPDGRFYYDGSNWFFDLTTGKRFFISSSFTEKSVGETEPLRTKGLSVYSNYTERYIENSQEYFFCNHIAFTPDSKYALAFYELKRTNFANPVNPRPNADGKYEIHTTKKWYVVRMELPH